MKQKLELTWIGKDARPKLEPRILLGDPENVENLPMASPPEPAVTASAPASNGRKGAKAVDAGQAGLFDGGGE